MMDSSFIKKRHKISKSPIILALLVVLLFILLRAAYGVYQKEKTSQEILDDRKEEYQELISRKENLEEELEGLNTDRGVEAEIRSKFGLIKEGEEVILLLDNTNVASSTEEEGKKNIFQRFLNLIF